MGNLHSYHPARIFWAIALTTVAIFSSASPINAQKASPTPVPKVKNGNIVFVRYSVDSSYNYTPDLFSVAPTGGTVKRLTNTETLGSGIESAVWSPDGKQIAFASSVGEKIVKFAQYSTFNHQLYTMNADGSSLVKISDGKSFDLTPAFSPDGTQLVFSSYPITGSGLQLFTMNVDGSSRRQLTNETGDHVSPSWSPDGTTIIYDGDHNSNSGYRQIWAINADGTNARILGGSNGNKYADAIPVFSPDGTQIVFQSSRAGKFSIYVMNSNGSNVKAVYPAESFSGGWSPDGKQITFRVADGTAWISDVDGSNPRPYFKDARNAFDLHFSPDGNSILYITSTGLYVAQPDGTDRKLVASFPSATINSPAWSPDGTQLAYSSVVNRHVAILIVNAAGLRQASIKSDDANLQSARWSPDGKFLVYTTDKATGREQIGIRAVDGSESRMLTDGSTNDANPDWSPDGKQIVFSRNDDNTPANLFVMDADGSNIHPLFTSTADNVRPVWSPDGQRIAFVSNRDGSAKIYDIYSVKADGTDVRRLTTADKTKPQLSSRPAWSPDGTQIAFCRRNDKNEFELYVMNANGSGVRKIAGATAKFYGAVDPAWQPLPVASKK